MPTCRNTTWSLANLLIREPDAWPQRAAGAKLSWNEAKRESSAARSL
jgi:hypothetical protein